MSISEVSQKKYILIDKVILKKDYKLSFDLYSNDENKNLVVVYKKHTLLKEQLFESLVSKESLYVEKREQINYEKSYQELNEQKEVTDEMSFLYDEIKNTLRELFKTPESLKTLQKANAHIVTLVEAVQKEKFALSSFLSTLMDDYYTHTHSLNVSIYAICLGKYLGMNKQELEDLGFAALLHDIGKSKIDSNIINKDGQLSEEEFRLVKTHSTHSYEILKNAGISNRHILEGVKYHHEKMDGSGYPDQLQGEEIHQYAKIIGLCDIFDALTTKRSYKESVDTFNTLVTMKKEMKYYLDGNLVNKFILMFRDSVIIV